MKEIIISAAISSVISFVTGTLVGEPVKCFFKGVFSKSENVQTLKSISKKIKKVMPDLLLEMKKDSLSNPYNREFIIMNKGCVYNGHAITYFFEDHEDLKGKLDILGNYQLIENITYNNTTDRYRMSEDFIEILKKYI